MIYTFIRRDTTNKLFLSTIQVAYLICTSNFGNMPQDFYAVHIIIEYNVFELPIYIKNA